MDADSLSDLLHSLFSDHNLTHLDSDMDIDNLCHVLSGYGIDLTSYSPEEISNALHYALGDGSGFETTGTGHYEVAFGSTEGQIKNDISYHEKRLASAESNVSYYSKELRRSNLSDSYVRDCEYRLKHAATQVEEETSKLKQLAKELDKVIRNRKS